ncbi:unnamed protein product [Nezara viridula]|uniref:Uncharacterized protein n=1 Tax=Nezara viridula TaxID=85310 RepID=A0A9P0HJE1_NEZVI|nr:unnamed protein product [Nezara viridula]
MTSASEARSIKMHEPQLDIKPHHTILQQTDVNWFAKGGNPFGLVSWLQPFATTGHHGSPNALFVRNRRQPKIFWRKRGGYPEIRPLAELKGVEECCVMSSLLFHLPLGPAPGSSFLETLSRLNTPFTGFY